MRDGGEDDACDGDEKEPRKKRIGAGKQLAGVGGEVIDRTHAAEQHGGIEGGINPAHVFEIMVADDANSQGDDSQCAGHQDVARHAHEKAILGNERFAMMFVHATVIP